MLTFFSIYRLEKFSPLALGRGVTVSHPAADPACRDTSVAREFAV